MSAPTRPCARVGILRLPCPSTLAPHNKRAAVRCFWQTLARSTSRRGAHAKAPATSLLAPASTRTGVESSAFVVARGKAQIATPFLVASSTPVPCRTSAYYNKSLVFGAGQGSSEGLYTSVPARRAQAFHLVTARSSGEGSTGTQERTFIIRCSGKAPVDRWYSVSFTTRKKASDLAVKGSCIGFDSETQQRLMPPRRRHKTLCVEASTLRELPRKYRPQIWPAVSNQCGLVVASSSNRDAALGGQRGIYYAASTSAPRRISSRKTSTHPPNDASSRTVKLILSA